MTDKEEKKQDPLEALEEIASILYDQLDKGKIPSMSLPSRTKKNIRFHPRLGVWKSKAPPMT